MGKGYLIDSNASIDFFNKSLPESGRSLLINSIPIISIVTFIEIFSKKSLSDGERPDLKDFTEAAIIYDVDTDVALRTIDIRLKYKIKIPDALIAATAIHYNLILVTRNLSDFNNISGLQIINPHAV